jgi:hemoglobin-like flavoprotein
MNKMKNIFWHTGCFGYTVASHQTTTINNNTNTQTTTSNGENMTPEQITLVQDSFAKVEPIADTAAELFYNRLFELDPSVRPMFKGDITEQGAKLMTMIGVAVHSLNNLEAILPAVQNLGVRHLEYGVTDTHYDTVAAALLWTLEQGLGPDFTPATKDAWTATYVTLATVMKDAAHAAEA